MRRQWISRTPLRVCFAASRESRVITRLRTPQVTISLLTGLGCHMWQRIFCSELHVLRHSCHLNARQSPRSRADSKLLQFRIPFHGPLFFLIFLSCLISAKGRTSKSLIISPHMGIEPGIFLNSKSTSKKHWLSDNPPP